ncbi:MAG: substrate-binding domain-containing protein [Pseudomonadota bacterium]
MSDMMTTHEVAAYLRLKERKIYDLVRREAIPFTRVTGKLLFQKALIDRWMAERTAMVTDAGAVGREVAVPPVIAGSRDPLLDWAARESGSGLALIAGGSRDGLVRFVEGRALVAGLHLLDPESGDYNVSAVREAAEGCGAVLIEWAQREQGLVVAAGNPLGLRQVGDLVKNSVRVVRRQPGAGTRELLDHLLRRVGGDPDRLRYAEETASTGHEVGLAVLGGRADAGLATRAVAHQLKLGFLPLATERFDLLIRRRDYFEPPFQKLMAFARGAAFRAQAASLTGYDISGLGSVHYNGP